MVKKIDLGIPLDQCVGLVLAARIEQIIKDITFLQDLLGDPHLRTSVYDKYPELQVKIKELAFLGVEQTH